jgi:hypothetical protein
MRCESCERLARALCDAMLRLHAQEAAESRKVDGTAVIRKLADIAGRAFPAAVEELRVAYAENRGLRDRAERAEAERAFLIDSAVQTILDPDPDPD